MRLGWLLGLEPPGGVRACLYLHALTHAHISNIPLPPTPEIHPPCYYDASAPSAPSAVPSLCKLPLPQGDSDAPERAVAVHHVFFFFFFHTPFRFVSRPLSPCPSSHLRTAAPLCSST